MCLINPIRELPWVWIPVLPSSVTFCVVGSLVHLAHVITRLPYLGRLVYFGGRCPRGSSVPDPSLPLSVAETLGQKAEQEKK